MQAEPQADNAAQIEYWNGSAGAQWRARQEHQDTLLEPVSGALLEAAAPRPGEHALDIGCGCGATTFDFARALAPNGDAIGVDVSTPMIDWARTRAPSGLPVRFVLADATTYPFPVGATDLVVSRFGVMFFADPAKSFANMRHALRPNGRTVFACWRAAKENPWMILPLRAAAKHAPPLPETNPDDPGPFSFANPDRVRTILTEAGYADIVIEPRDVIIDVAASKGVEAALESALSIGPTHRILANQDEAVRAAASEEIRKEFAACAIGNSVPL